MIGHERKQQEGPGFDTLIWTVRAQLSVSFLILLILKISCVYYCPELLMHNHAACSAGLQPG